MPNGFKLAPKRAYFWDEATAQSSRHALGTADEVMATVSADPGATGATMRFTFLGIVGG